MMRRCISTLVLVIVTLTASAATKADADKLFEQENFAQAAIEYASLLKNNGASSDVYYNLGNCYYRLDSMPKAILCYERALMISPGDGDIRTNLALARGKITDKAVPPSELFFVTWWRTLVNSMSIDAWSIIGITAFVLALVGVLCYLFVSRLIVRKIGIYGAMALTVLCVLANLAALTQHLSYRSHNAAIVMSPSVAVKGSPSDSGTDVFVIHEGTKLDILDDSVAEWLEVKYEEGQQGWIHTSDVEII